MGGRLIKSTNGRGCLRVYTEGRALSSARLLRSSFRSLNDGKLNLGGWGLHST